MNLLIVGGGVLAYFLSQSLIRKGHRVVVINRDGEECIELSRRLNATIVKGDATRPRLLEDAGIRTQDAVLAITPNDADNLLICQSSARLFGVRRALALVNDPQNEEIFHRLGVPETISVTSVISALIERRSAFDSISNLFGAFNGKVEVAEAVVKDGSPADGLALKALDLPASTLVAAVNRGSEEIIPNGDTVLLAGDQVLVVTRPEVFDSAMGKIAGGA